MTLACNPGGSDFEPPVNGVLLLMAVRERPLPPGRVCLDMATDEEAQPSEDDMLPDEREVLPERGERLDVLDEDDLLTVEQVADNLDIDVE